MTPSQTTGQRSLKNSPVAQIERHTFIIEANGPEEGPFALLTGMKINSIIYIGPDPQTSTLATMRHLLTLPSGDGPVDSVVVMFTFPCPISDDKIAARFKNCVVVQRNDSAATTIVALLGVHGLQRKSSYRESDLRPFF